MSWRNERFDDATLSLDAMLEGVDLAKAAFLSDRGAGAERVYGACDREDGGGREFRSAYNRKIDAARKRLVRAGLGYAVPTLLLVCRNGRRRRESILEIAAARRLSAKAAKKVYFGHLKKIEKIFFAQCSCGSDEGRPSGKTHFHGVNAHMDI